MINFCKKNFKLNDKMPMIVIIGAGPAGLGAAWRLNEIGYSHWFLIERESQAGGLAGSTVDSKGFVWDFGGHVLFSHYEYFDNLMNEILRDRWLSHVRESWIWIENKFVPYPLQNNIHYLSQEALWDCLKGIINSFKKKNSAFQEFNNFKDLALSIFGEGIYHKFMEPYNLKVWAYPLEYLSSDWIQERVAKIDLEKILHNIIFNKDDKSWGPNSTFRFPAHGGTGTIWRTIAGRLPSDKIKYNIEFSFLNSKEKIVSTSEGKKISYDYLISTIPLNSLIRNSDLKSLKKYTENLKYSSTHIIGIGLKGKTPEHLKTKCWIYYPESNCPFYRITIFSNYSPNNVQNPDNEWSIMAEVSESHEKSVDSDNLVENVIRGCLDTKLIDNTKTIISTWTKFLPYGYPTPSIDRNAILDMVSPHLERNNILSRGRFGAWKYEIGNMDHSFMQGVECVNRVLFGTPEITLNHPSIVNKI